MERSHTLWLRTQLHRRLPVLGVSLLFGGLAALGCRGYQYGHIVKNDQPDLVGSHAAGAEVFNPLVDETVAKLLATQEVATQSPVFGPDGQPACRTIYFVGVENKSAEELGDFKDQIYQQIDAQINRSQAFRAISSRAVESGLRETRLRPDDLLRPENMRLFCSIMERDGQPIHYLLHAKLTSGTTERNKSSQRDYLLTLELTDTATLAYTKEQASIRKGYHSTYLGKAINYNPFKAWK